ncbi:MAG: hypothetical protein ABL897_12105, partial [Hyphomicrobium sp.]
MPERKIEIKPIQFALTESRDNAASADESYASTAHAFAVVLADLAAAYGQRFGGASTGRDPVGLAAVASEFLRLMRSLDAQYGTVGTLPIENADAAVDEALTALAELDPWLQRLDLTEHRSTLNATLLAICHWAMCHDLRFRAVAPIVNALAEQSNAAESRQETAAVFALMQGLIEHLAPDLSGDLEQSNPERPWRLLNLNLAI